MGLPRRHGHCRRRLSAGVCLRPGAKYGGRNTRLVQTFFRRRAGNSQRRAGPRRHRGHAARAFERPGLVAGRRRRIHCRPCPDARLSQYRRRRAHVARAAGAGKRKPGLHQRNRRFGRRYRALRLGGNLQSFRTGGGHLRLGAFPTTAAARASGASPKARCCSPASIWRFI